jgi:hypothetical protein
MARAQGSHEKMQLHCSSWLAIVYTTSLTHSLAALLGKEHQAVHCLTALLLYYLTQKSI